MQQTDDDMDELFRKAAENYPLKTDNPDWEKVRPFVLSSTVDTDVDKSSKKKYRNLLWLLLLIPIGWAGYKMVINSNNQQLSANSVPADKESAPASAKIPKAENKIDNNNLKTNKSTPVVISYTKRTTPFIKRSTQLNSAVIPSSITEKGDMQIDNNNVESPSKKIEEEIKPEKAGKDISDDDVKDFGNKKTTIGATGNDNSIISGQKKEMAHKEKVFDSSVNIENKKASKNISKTKPSYGFYLGAIVGPDFSTVKFQSTRKLGFNIGVLVGYQFNKIFSVESGLLWDKKFYNSDGKYFNTSKIPIPPDSKILNVNGNCNMIEVPINIKINFSSSAKTSWFAVAGMSSYFMNREDYNYTITNAAGGYPYPYFKSYKESSTFLFPVINAGLGYTHQAGKNILIRIEPYAKIPVSGVGLGKLPITSTGINLGIIKKLFNQKK